MPQLLSGGGGSLSASGLVLAQPPYEGGAGGSSGGSSSSSRASSTSSSSAGRFRAVVAISSDDDRDRIFYDDDDQDSGGVEIKTYKRNSSYSQSPCYQLTEDCVTPAPVGTESHHSGVSRPPATTGPPPAPPKAPPKPPARPPARPPTGSGPAVARKKPSRAPAAAANGGGPAMAATALGMPEASRWCGADGSLPKVVAHENGAIVNGYLLVNGTEHPLDLPLIEQNSAKRYHVSELLTQNGNHGNVASKEQLRSQVVVESTFAGSRDVKNPDTLRDLKIVSNKGTIRGVKNRVRAGIATFLDGPGQDVNKTLRGTEKGKIVIYVTSMRIIRETYERCQKARMILQTHMVCYEEVDIFMSKENQRALMERLGTDHVIVPQVFADGQHLGGVEELDYMNESGELRQIFQSFKKVQHTTSCTKCGGYRFVNCPSCHGSKKSLNRNHFTEEFCALRCVNCDENGLVRCDSCSDEEPEKKK